MNGVDFIEEMKEQNRIVKYNSCDHLHATKFAVPLYTDWSKRASVDYVALLD